jgi:hypothetical protein
MLIRTQHNWGADRGSFTDNINTTPFYTILAGGYPSPTGITARLAPKTNKAFIIPLNDFVLRKLTSQARSEVAYNSISLTFYITVTTTTSWWKSLIKSFLVIAILLSPVTNEKSIEIAAVIAIRAFSPLTVISIIPLTASPKTVVAIIVLPNPGKTTLIRESKFCNTRYKQRFTIFFRRI